jgi:short-subunit dehydrogenase involved in D-alanine esterification of teichoic acids
LPYLGHALDVTKVPDWTGKTALITGGASGIGFGIDRAFSAAGIELILTYRDESQRNRAAKGSTRVPSN